MILLLNVHVHMGSKILKRKHSAGYDEISRHEIKYVSGGICPIL